MSCCPTPDAEDRRTGNSLTKVLCVAAFARAVKSLRRPGLLKSRARTPWNSPSAGLLEPQILLSPASRQRYQWHEPDINGMATGTYALIPEAPEPCPSTLHPRADHVDEQIKCFRP